MSTQLDIASLVDQQIRQTLTEYLEGINLKSVVDQAMAFAITDMISKMSVRTAETMIKQRDLSDEVLGIAKEKIDSQVDAQVKSSIRSVIAATDIKKLVGDAVNRELKIHINQYNFPEASIPARSIDWKGLKLSGDMIDGGIIQNFNSVGIQDNATECQLTIVDGMIVAEGQFISDNIVSKKAEIDAISVNTLDISGNISLGQQARDTISSLVSEIFNRDLDIGEHAITNGVDRLLTHQSLGPSIVYSNIRKLGLLQDLNVSGSATIGSTMIVNDRKVGINTENPNGALTVWDDDAELSVLKLAKKQMFIGSTRGSDIIIGTNADERMRIGVKEVSISGPLRIMGIRFSVADAVPDRQGEPKEIVMLINAGPGQPMFYMCQGSNTWAALEIKAP
jgi:hypothetical protein